MIEAHVTAVAVCAAITNNDPTTMHFFENIFGTDDGGGIERDHARSAPKEKTSNELDKAISTTTMKG